MLYYNDSEFVEMDDLPNESTLEVNITHHQMNRLRPSTGRVVAISPTRVEEGKSTDPTAPLGKGYDITFNTAAEFVFQHKAPKKTVVRGDNYSEKRQWLQFELDNVQLVNLATQYGPGQAYYVFPLIPEQSQIKTGLSQVVFIDVFEILANSLSQGQRTSYVLFEYSSINQTPYPKACGKFTDQDGKWAMETINKYPYYELGFGEHISFPAIGWPTLSDAFRTGVCGLPIRGKFRSDGDDRYQESPPVNVELFPDFTNEYQRHVERKLALYYYATRQEDYNSEVLLEWLIEDLLRRTEQAVMDEIITSSIESNTPVSSEAEWESPRAMLADLLRNIQSSRRPIRYRTSNTKRIVVEEGRDDTISLSI